MMCLQDDPFMMERDDPALTGNARFAGFCVDLLHEIAHILQFNYTIKLVDDGKYGAPEGPNGEWSGMVRELMDRVCFHFFIYPFILYNIYYFPAFVYLLLEIV